MFKIKVEATFSAAHNLRGYKGKCEDLHGHNWKVEVVVANNKLDKIGMVMDFKLLKRKLSRLLERLDHKYLNNVVYFKKVNPTSENMAKYIYDSLKPEIAAIYSVTVWESDNSCATYYAE
ncbi:MAG: 6-carboxytetrahydropterin synthase QueD [Candidatus Omnitrophica bacterium]|nr:6-carboxytetrahydropterin synthase QueD [Candidatus Omnitrophota bacterium]